MDLKQISLPESVTIEDYNHLKPLSMLKAGLYRIVMPSGVDGSLMKLTTTEMEGLSTTSIISEGKIVGHAGLEEVEVDHNTTNLLSRLSNYSMLAAHVNELSINVKTLLNTIHQNQQAEINNIFAIFRDISLKMPSFISDSNYSLLAMQSLSLLKHEAGKYFQLFKTEFIKEYHDLYLNQDFNFLIEKLRAVRSHSAVKIFEVLIMIEIYEILISGKSNQKYINIARQSLEEKAKFFADAIYRLKEQIKKNIDYSVELRKGYVMTYYDHMRSEEQENEQYKHLEVEFQNSKGSIDKPKKIFNGSLIKDGSQDVLFKIDFADTLK